MFKFSSALLLIANQAYAYSQSLADCLAAAALFDNTCTNNTPVTDWTKGASVSCTGAMRCPGAANGFTLTYSASSPCTFTRVLCVTCSTSSKGVV